MQLNNLRITRTALTKIFIKQWGKVVDDINIKQFLQEWWYASQSSNPYTYRLSIDGLKFLTDTLGITAYEILIGAQMITPQLILTLDKYLKCPYFLDSSTLTVFSESMSIEMYMFSNDVRRFGLAHAITTLPAPPA